MSTDDRSVLDAVGVPWWFMAAQLPFTGVDFALDGVLAVARDRLGSDGYLVGPSAFMVLRLGFVGWRAFSGRWLVPGTGH